MYDFVFIVNISMYSMFKSHVPGEEQHLNSQDNSEKAGIVRIGTGRSVMKAH